MQTALRDTANVLRPPAPDARGQRPGLFALVKALWNNPLEAWTSEHFERPIILHDLHVGRIAIVSDPPSIRRVLNDNARNYRKDRFQHRMLRALTGGILTAEGEQWRSQRSMFAPIFTPRTVRTLVPGMQAAVGALVARWQALDEGTVVDVASEMVTLALEVLERTMFSDGFGQDIDRIREAMRVFFDGIGRVDPMDFLGLPAFLPRFGRPGVRSATKLFDTAMDTMIAQRRQRLTEVTDAAPRDMLTLLLRAQDPETGRGLSESDVRANVLTFMTAGHETTANAITWILYLLSQSQAWHRRVRAEVDREWDKLANGAEVKLPDLQAVVDETLRLYPPLVAISRAADNADELAGHRIAPGALVVVAPYVLHRHRLLWERPNHFDPTRFLPGQRETIDRYSYLPFGAGPRVCIGATFATQETLLAVASIVRHFDLELVPNHAVRPVHRVTLRPAGGLPMVLRKRQPAPSPAERQAPALMTA